MVVSVVPSQGVRPVVLIACVKTKLPRPAPAKELYTSDLFKKSFRYAESLNPKCIFILSALHGLVPPERVIAPYEKTLKTMGVSERKAWAQSVLLELAKATDVERDHFVFLAGRLYRENLVNTLDYKVPMEGLAFGQQLQWLKRHTLS